MLRLFAFILALGLLPGGTHAASVDLSLPLEGHYRPGKYLPVRVAADAPAGAVALALSAENAVQTRLAVADGRVRGIAPFLPLGTMRQLTWAWIGADGAMLASGQAAVAWRELRLDQRLVGFTSVDMEAARAIFPDDDIVPVRLDPAAPIPAPAIAWDALDAILLDSASAIPEPALADLLSAGVRIAVRGDNPPDLARPWRRVGSCWVLGHLPGGPKRAGENAPAYAPVQGWEADWPPAFRRRIVLYAVAFAVIALALALFRFRGSWLAMIGLSAVTVIALGAWWHNRSPVVQRAGQVLVVAPDWTQADTWIYRASARPTVDRLVYAGVMRPYLEAPAQERYMNLALHCAEDGAPLRWEYAVMPGLKAAFLSRQVEPQRLSLAPGPAGESPLRRLGTRVYVRPGEKIWGMVQSRPPAPFDHADGEWWGTLILERLPVQ